MVIPNTTVHFPAALLNKFGLKPVRDQVSSYLPSFSVVNEQLLLLELEEFKSIYLSAAIRNKHYVVVAECDDPITLHLF